MSKGRRVCVIGVGMTMFARCEQDVRDLTKEADFKERLLDPPPIQSGVAEAYGTLFRFSGFPEPFVKADARFYNAWFQERKSLLVREDIPAPPASGKWTPARNFRPGSSA